MTAIAVLGDRDPALVTHRDLDAELARMPAGVRAAWHPTDEPLGTPDGIWVAPGSPYRDDAAVLAAIGRAIDERIPLLGTCGGFQYACLALARRAGHAAAHAETDPHAADPLIAPLACSLRGQEREVTCVPGTRLAAICGTAPFTGWHFCGYGLAARRVAAVEAAGAVVCAHAPDAGAEGVELPDHPFFVATLFQPQAGAGGGAPRHPLVAAFLRAASGLDERVEAA